MRDYTNYKAEDLLLDEGFLNYCRESHPADSVFWEQMLAQDPALAAEAAKALQLFQLLSISTPTAEKERALGKIQAIIAGEETPVIQIRGRANWWRYAAAAILIGVLLLGALWYNHSAINSRGNQSVADFSRASFKEVTHTADDRRKNVSLPDGSVAELNYGTVLKIADNYNEKDRWVYLEGEAFFSVTKDPAKPFVVITRTTATEALGTSFKVKSYTGQPGGNTMLATGKVKVQAVAPDNGQEPVLLVPGEEAAWNGSQPMVKSNFDLGLIQDWRESNIILEKANLEKIIRTLEFYYGVQVKLQNEPRTAIAFNGKFFNKPLKDVLETIAFTNKFEYLQSGNTVFIRFQ